MENYALKYCRIKFMDFLNLFSLRNPFESVIMDWLFTFCISSNMNRWSKTCDQSVWIRKYELTLNLLFVSSNDHRNEIFYKSVWNCNCGLAICFIAYSITVHFTVLIVMYNYIENYSLERCRVKFSDLFKHLLFSGYTTYN